MGWAIVVVVSDLCDGHIVGGGWCCKWVQPQDATRVAVRNMLLSLSLSVAVSVTAILWLLYHFNQVFSHASQLEKKIGPWIH